MVKYSTWKTYLFYLYSENAKDDKEGTADQDDVSNGFKRSDQSFHHQLQTRSSANHPEKYHLTYDILYILVFLLGKQTQF